MKTISLKLYMMNCSKRVVRVHCIAHIELSPNRVQQKHDSELKKGNVYFHHSILVPS